MPHKRLIHKLNYYGITGSIATWIETFLTGRTQQVVVNGATSSGLARGGATGAMAPQLLVNVFFLQLIYVVTCIQISLLH